MKVLQVSMGNAFGGIERLELDWCMHMHKCITFDFLTPNNIPFRNYKEQIEECGGHVYDLNINRDRVVNRFIYMLRLFKFLNKNRYDVIHINSSAFFFSFQVALIAKLFRTKKVIVHAHSVPKINKLKNFFKCCMSPIFVKCVDEFLSCSKIAEKALYTDNFIKKDKIIVLKNGVDAEKFKFNKHVREIYCEKWRIKKQSSIWIYWTIGNAKKSYVCY